METGSSENWRDTLSLAIGENRLDGSALREFFQPLEEWLRNENLRTGQFIGWTYGKSSINNFKLNYCVIKFDNVIWTIYK